MSAKTRFPSYRRLSSGQAHVTLDSKDHLLGTRRRFSTGSAALPGFCHLRRYGASAAQLAELREVGNALRASGLTIPMPHSASSTALSEAPRLQLDSATLTITLDGTRYTNINPNAFAVVRMLAIRMQENGETRSLSST
jgi:hypothetical protein